MAKIGLQNFLYGVLTEASDGTASYGAGIKPGKAVSCNVSISSNDAKLYADDGLAESDTSFQSGTVSIEVDNADLTTQATLLGHTISGEEIGYVENIEEFKNIATGLILSGHMDTVSANFSDWDTNPFEGTIINKEDEVNAFWVDKDSIPLNEMREADQNFMPDLLAGKYINRRYHYDENFKLKKKI